MSMQCGLTLCTCVLPCATAAATVSLSLDFQSELVSQLFDIRDDYSHCFSLTSSVTKRDGSVVPMATVQPGDAVRTVDPVTGDLSFADVYAVSHLDKTTATPYARITARTASGVERTVTATARHLLFAAPAGYTFGSTALARDVHVGWTLWVEGAGDTLVPAVVTDTRVVFEAGTVNIKIVGTGTVIVDGVAAVDDSDECASGTVCGALLFAPIEALYHVVPTWVMHSVSSMLCTGSDAIASVQGWLLPSTFVPSPQDHAAVYSPASTPSA